MKEHFANLRALQDIDTDLKHLRERLEDLPRRINELNRNVEAVKLTLEEKRQVLREYKKQYKLTEVELHTTEEKIANYSVQLYSAKDNVQYKALIKEIEVQKKNKNNIEDKLLTLLEDIEQLEKEIQIFENSVKETEIENCKKIAMLNVQKVELDAAIAEREKSRQEIATNLPAELYRRYERIRASKGGIAVTSTELERCNGCLSPIPPQRLLEIERQDKLYLCETCGRILLPLEKKTSATDK